MTFYVLWSIVNNHLREPETEAVEVEDFAGSFLEEMSISCDA